MTAIVELFGKPKALIAMAHFLPLPGQATYDADGGIAKLRDGLARDLEVLAVSGFDAVMFCNEGDRPYRTKVGPATPATMAAVITSLKGELGAKPFGVDVLWDPSAAIAIAHAVGACFVREVVTGSYAGDFGIWNTDPAETLGLRRSLGAEQIKLLCNITAEFAAPVAPREIGLTAKSAVFSSLCDAVCVSGDVTGEGVDLSKLQAAKAAVGPDVAVVANTGVRPDTIGSILNVVDACIVGTALKRDGNTWNEVEADRVARLLDAAVDSGYWQPS